MARRGATLVFCEVKARTTGAFGLPAEAVTPAKQARLRKLAVIWLRSEGPRLRAAGGFSRPEMRFDVACVLAGRLEVIQEAF